MNVHSTSIASSSMIAINFYSRLNLPGLKVEVKYQELVTKFMTDLLFVQEEYNEHRDNPPLARNLPPISGKIAWSRQLYHRIATPVAVFQKNKQLMQLPETKRAIKHYNRLARVLVEYELVFLRIWNQQLDMAKASINSTVLLKVPHSRELIVNFDPKIKELLRDIQVLNGMGIDVPTEGLLFYAEKLSLMKKYGQITVSVKLID